ncbi:hypothetical protein ABZ388_10565 [Micromonospora parva]|uniref:hypothetical protein n=1 Tax=Micromonospora parva TaxID=1464048 RepID=UPI0033EC23A6
MSAEVIASTGTRVTPVLVRHAVVVRLAELGQTFCDLEALKRLAFKVCVDRQQLWLGVPA